MSSAPDGLLPASCEPTGSGVPVLPSLPRLPFEGSHVSPHGYLRPSVPRAASSHSDSVGSRLPDHLAYATASSHVTKTTGHCSVPGFGAPLTHPSLGGACFSASTKALY